MDLLIADDDALITDQLKHFAGKLGVANVRVTSDGVEALAAIKQQKPDALILDLRMPGMSGPELLAAIGDEVPVIICTGDRDFAVESYRFHVVDYIMKPVTFDAFARAMRKIEERSANMGGATSTVFVRTGSDIARIDLREVRYVKSDSNYVRFVLADDKEIASLMNMKDLEAKLPASFVRTHRSYIVNLDHVEKLDSMDIKIGRALVPVSDSYRAEVLGRLNLL